MTNKEFYGDKLLAITLKTACRRLRNVIYDESCVAREKCDGCEFYTVESIENWLNAEHERLTMDIVRKSDVLKLIDNVEFDANADYYIDDILNDLRLWVQALEPVKASAIPEYITKEQAIDEVWDAFTFRDDPDLGRVIKENIERLPAADVAPVVHGK